MQPISTTVTSDQEIISAFRQVLAGRQLVAQQRQRLTTRPTSTARKRLRFHERTLAIFEAHLAAFITQRGGLPAQW